MNTSIAVVGPGPGYQSARPRDDGGVAVFAGVGTSLILAAIVLVFGRGRSHPVFSAGRTR
jgi:hypothetical protein